MKFNSEKVSFGRHETFALRYSWLPKGFQAISGNKFDISNPDEATIHLGVGKNMVSSIRYWLKACQIVDENEKPTSIGERIFLEDGLDPYMEDEATLWLIHWLLASNPTQATAWYWFFNKFHRSEFTANELQTALSDFVKENVTKGKRPATNTIKNDANLLVRMYSISRASKATAIEESLDSPLSLLRLISQSTGDRGFISKAEARPALPTGVFAFAVSQLLQAKGGMAMPIEDLLHSKDDYPAVGTIFRLTETDLVTKLELMVQYIKGAFEIRETAGIHQIYQVNAIDPIKYLKKHYSDSAKGLAA